MSAFSSSSAAAAAVTAETGGDDLDRKFELLEARFTQPIGLLSSRGGGGGGGGGGYITSSSTNNNNSTNNSLLSPLLGGGENSNLSEHSFSFSGSNHGGGAGAGGTTMIVRNKKKDGGPITSLDMVSRAAARHMRKVAATSPVMGGSSSAAQHSNFSFSSGNSGGNNNGGGGEDNNDDSQETFVTGNTKSTTISSQLPPTNNNNAIDNDGRIAIESPPVVVSPHRGKGGNSRTNKPNVARVLPLVNNNDDHQQQQQQQQLPKSTGSATKRKSVPKRKISSIQDKLQSPTSTSTSTATGTGTTDAAVGKSGTSATTTSSAPTTTTPTSSNIMSSRSRSPNRSSFVGISGDHSRDRSNGGSSSGNKKPRILIPPANNKRIHDFFSKVQQQNNGGDGGNADNNNSNNNTGRNTTATTTAAANTSVNDNTTATAPRNSNNTNGTNAATGNMTSSTKTVHLSSSTIDAATTAAAAAITEQWEAKYVRLQQQLQDRDEQLKAVTGNKTILHTALQQALTKTRNELNELQESTTKDRSNINSVLEDTMRWKFLKIAKDLRVSLSQDGNRLGKIVSTRAGMRVIDSWEEGYASKDWQSRKEEWKLKHRTLLDRQAQLKIRLKQQYQDQQQQHQPDGTGSNNNAGNNNNSTKNNDEPTTIMSQLEIQEAKESIQMHLETLHREEQELLTEEQTLNDEKGAHIRALKRVASEDASRFRVRPKLHNRYVLDCLLGKGGFSEVWKGYDLQELREVAVKIHQLDPRWPDSKKENYTKHVSREYEIHRNVRHTRIVSLYDVFEIDNNSFATVLECCQGTDLDTLLKRKKRLPERQARAILLQILTGMQYLSQPSGSRQGIIHYDLKPGNILFDEFGDAKITDFGLSKIVDTPDPAESMELTSQGAGTYWYLPPECFVTGEQVRISNKVDVWSIGVIFYQMIYGKRPFGEGKSQDKLLADHTMLNAQEVHLPERPDVSDRGKEFIKQCLMYDQAFRPTIAQLCDNSYVLQNNTDGSSITVENKTALK